MIYNLLLRYMYVGSCMYKNVLVGGGVEWVWVVIEPGLFRKYLLDCYLLEVVSNRGNNRHVK